LLLLSLGVLAGAVMADGAAGGGAKKAVMAGNVASNTADDRALDAAFGISRGRGDGKSESERRAGKKSFGHGMSSVVGVVSIRHVVFRSGADKCRLPHRHH
jgi:hypothetical protein